METYIKRDQFDKYAHLEGMLCYRAISSHYQEAIISSHQRVPTHSAPAGERLTLGQSQIEVFAKAKVCQGDKSTSEQNPNCG